MNERTLFLAWQDRERTREWFPIGRLDADVARSFYRFRYTGGAKDAREKVGFPPLWDFPNLGEDYRSSDLFPLFRNRVIAPGRPDRADYLSNLDLPEDADPIEILSVNGGFRMTDHHEAMKSSRNSRKVKTAASGAGSSSTVGGTRTARHGNGWSA